MSSAHRGQPAQHLGPTGPGVIGERASAERIRVARVGQLTGVTRERLRTWERRHDFPRPEHLRNGVRTYAMADVPLIVAVSRLIAAGYPVREAIATVLGPAHDDVGVDIEGTALHRAPMPAIALARSPRCHLRVVWANLATRLQPGSLGEVIGRDAAAERLGAAAIAAVDSMLGDDRAEFPQILEHLDWVGTFPAACRSLCWPVELDDGDTALMLLQIPKTVGGDGAVPHVEHDAARWASAIGGARRVLQREGGLVSAQHALRELVERIHAFDGLLALRHGQELRTASSVRGMVSARALDPALFDGLWNGGRVGGETRWLTPPIAEALGLPTYLKFLALPLGIGGQQLGATVLCFSRVVASSESVLELLQGFGLALAATVQRDRIASSGVVDPR